MSHCWELRTLKADCTSHYCYSATLALAPITPTPHRYNPRARKDQAASPATPSRSNLSAVAVPHNTSGPSTKDRHLYRTARPLPDYEAFSPCLGRRANGVRSRSSSSALAVGRPWRSWDATSSRRRRTGSRRACSKMVMSGGLITHLSASRGWLEWKRKSG